MNHNFLDDFSKALIREVENECAANDPDEIGDAAAMVLVGDVYALHVCHGEALNRDQTEMDVVPTDDRVSPFIR
jgi:hypothetical protein